MSLGQIAYIRLCDNTTVAPRSIGDSELSTAGERHESDRRSYRCPHTRHLLACAPHDAGERSQSDGGRSFLAHASLPGADVAATPARLSLRTAFGVEPAPHIQRTESLCGGARCSDLCGGARCSGRVSWEMRVVALKPAGAVRSMHDPAYGLPSTHLPGNWENKE
jgi:hypothetical protein